MSSGKKSPQAAELILHLLSHSDEGDDLLGGLVVLAVLCCYADGVCQ